MVDDFMLDDKIIKNKGHLGEDILNNIIKNLKKADEAIEDAYQEINKHDELDHVYYESFDEDLREFNKYRWKYNDFTNYADEYEAMVDSKFKDNMEQLCEKLSNIRLEDIKIDNNLGIVDSEGSHYDTFGGTRLKYKIDIEDLLNVGYVDEAMKAEYEERRQMVQAMQKMVEEDNWPEGISEEQKGAIREYINSLNGGALESYDDEIKNLLTQGEFNFITKGEQNLSLGLDFVPVVGDVKGIIEACTGKEMITNRELSDEERVMTGISSVIGLIPGVGEIGTIAKTGEKLGAKMAVKEAAKYTIKETMQGAGMYGASSIASNLGITPKEQLMAIGGMSLFRSGKNIITDHKVATAIDRKINIAKNTINNISDVKGVYLGANGGGIWGLIDNYNQNKSIKSQIADTARKDAGINKIPSNVESIRIRETEKIKFNRINRRDIKEWTSKAYARWLDSLTEDEKDAISAYTEDDYYININAVLRGIEDEYQWMNEEFMKSITNALNKAEVPENITVYRGTNQKMLSHLSYSNSSQLIGKIINDNAFMSTSLDSTVSEMGFTDNLQLIIDVPRGTKGAYIGSLSEFGDDEQELLLNRGQKMIIKEVVNDNPGKLVLRVEIMY